MKDSRKVQSSELCYPCKILIAKDSKTLYDNYYSDLFSFFKQVTEQGFGEFTVKENSSGISWFPFIISSPQDFQLIVLLEIHGKGGVAHARERLISAASVPACLTWCIFLARLGVIIAFLRAKKPATTGTLA
jgi:hypothetical protein